MPANTHSFEFAPLDQPLGSRINVRGAGGKTTLSRAIAQRHEMPFIELDALSHLPNWVSRDIDEFREITRETIADAGDRWLVDGNYTGDLGDTVLLQADTVIWIDLPWRVAFWRILTRSIRRARDKRPICGDNTESWGRILSRDSLWWWYVKNRKRLRARGERFLPMVPAGVPVIRIGSRRDLDRFYELQELSR